MPDQMRESPSVYAIVVVKDIGSCYVLVNKDRGGRGLNWIKVRNELDGGKRDKTCNLVQRLANICDVIDWVDGRVDGGRGVEG